MAETAVSSLLKELSQLLAHEANLLSGVHDEVNSLQSELRMLYAFLKYIERNKLSNEILDEVVNQIKDVAQESEDVIDTFIARVTKQRRRNMGGWIIHSASHAMMLHKVAGKIKVLKNKMNEIHNNKMKYNIENMGSTSTGEDPQIRELINKRRRYVEEDDVLGFTNDSSIVIQQLKEGGSRSRLTIVSIIGMGGLGKTTLARKIYNNNQVRNYFACFAWVYVSNDYRPKEILLTLLKCLNLISQDVYSLSESELKNKVQECLKGKRYLVVLDDIWNTKDWDQMRDIFPDDGNGSRILITSRIKEMASHMGHIPPYNLSFLNAEDSWKLFSKKVFQGEDCPSDLEPLGQQIAKSCRGLPLSIVVLSGLLANKEKSQREWSKIMGHVNWYLTQDGTPVKDIVLKLSYDSLPQRLKPCFLYFGAFPEDFEVRVRPLIQKWVAEGFIQQSGTRNPEDVAEDYLYELVDRSLIQVASWRSDGGVKTCRIHDLLRELCISEGEKDKFFEVCMDTSILTPNRTKPRRLSIHCSMPSYVSSINCDHSCTRTLFSFNKQYAFTRKHWKWLRKGFKLARVLDIGQVVYFRPSSILSKLEALNHIRYLRLDCNVEQEIRGKIIVIPDSICDLWNLETLDLSSFYRVPHVVFPGEMWKLKRLRHLHIVWPLILDDFSGSETRIMRTLQTLSNVVLNKQVASLIQEGMFPNLRKLGLSIKPENDCEQRQLLGSLKHLTHLNALRIDLDDKAQAHAITHASLFSVEPDTFPSSITKITWTNIETLSTESMETLANLTNLQILKLSGRDFISQTLFDLHFFPGWFPQLQVFQMIKLGVQNWKLANGAMPRLQRLVIRYCPSLVSFPNELCSLTGLRQIRTSECIKLPPKLQHLEVEDEPPACRIQ